VCCRGPRRAPAANAPLLHSLAIASLLDLRLRDQPCRGVQIRARLLRRSLLDLAQQFRRRLRQNLRPRPVPHQHDYSNNHVVLFWVWILRGLARTGAKLVLSLPSLLRCVGCSAAWCHRCSHACKGCGWNVDRFPSAFGPTESRLLVVRACILVARQRPHQHCQ